MGGIYQEIDAAIEIAGFFVRREIPPQSLGHSAKDENSDIMCTGHDVAVLIHSRGETDHYHNISVNSLSIVTVIRGN